MTAGESCRMPFTREIAAPVEVVDLAGLAKTHAAMLYKVAHAVLRNPDEARDVVQDVFVRVLRQRARLPEIADMRVWLVRIAWNLALDRRKRKRGDQMDADFAGQLAATEPSAQHVLESRERFAAVLRAIDRLPAAERQALLLLTVEELGTPEIARVMGRSEAAVRGLVHRARTRLHNETEAR